MEPSRKQTRSWKYIHSLTTREHRIDRTGGLRFLKKIFHFLPLPPSLLPLFWFSFWVQVNGTWVEKSIRDVTWRQDDACAVELGQVVRPER